MQHLLTKKNYLSAHLTPTGKLAGILCCFVGVMLVTWHDELLQQQQGNANSDIADSTDTTETTSSENRSTFSLLVDAMPLNKALPALQTVNEAARRILKFSVSNMGSGTERGLVGDAASLVSAMLYGYYTVVLRMNVSEGDEEDRSTVSSEAKTSDPTHVGGNVSPFHHTNSGNNESNHDLRRSPPVHDFETSSLTGDITRDIITSDSCSDTVVENPTEMTPTLAFSAPPEIPLSLVLGYVGLLVTVCGVPVLLVCSAYCLESLCRYVIIYLSAGDILVVAIKYETNCA